MSDQGFDDGEDLLLLVARTIGRLRASQHWRRRPRVKVFLTSSYSTAAPTAVARRRGQPYPGATSRAMTRRGDSLRFQVSRPRRSGWWLITPETTGAASLSWRRTGLSHFFSLSRAQSSRRRELGASSASTMIRIIDSVFDARTCIHPSGSITLTPSVAS
jgi:hypothetical protein